MNEKSPNINIDISHKSSKLEGLIFPRSENVTVRHQSQGIFLSVLAKTQFVQNAKTQFEKAKTQFENRKSPKYCKFYNIQYKEI